jgi:predicted ribosomally synthesized peptide with SipW-like signal peptide
MSKSRKVLRTLAVVGVLAALAGVGAFSVFSDFTDNENNQVTAGTVNIDDNDGGTALYNFTNAKPGQSAAARCIRVDYTGTLPANVKLYTTSTIGALGPNVNLKVEAGTQGTFAADCTGFTSQQTLFDAALSTFPTTYAGGVSDFPNSETSWDNGESVVYKFTATLSASTPNGQQGASTGLHTFRWEAQNQP